MERVTPDRSTKRAWIAVLISMLTIGSFALLFRLTVKHQAAANTTTYEDLEYDRVRMAVLGRFLANKYSGARCLAVRLESLELGGVEKATAEITGLLEGFSSSIDLISLMTVSASELYGSEPAPLSQRLNHFVLNCDLVVLLAFPSQSFLQLDMWKATEPRIVLALGMGNPCGRDELALMKSGTLVAGVCLLESIDFERSRHMLTKYNYRIPKSLYEDFFSTRYSIFAPSNHQGGQ